MNKAYSEFTIKSIDEEQRFIRGIATTPKPDRENDIIDPMGAKFTLPIPFLWQHDSKTPCGNVVEAQVTPKGIEVGIQFPKIEEVGLLKDEVDKCWQSIKYKLVRGLSVGFRPLGSESVESIGGSYGLHFKEWDWYELSAVTIQANTDAIITEIKSVDQSDGATVDNPIVQPELIVGVTTKHTVVNLIMPTKAGVKLL